MFDKISMITNQTPVIEQTNKLPNLQTTTQESNFSNVLKSAINNINNIQKESDLKTELLARGEITDLHDVMITAQKASITLETAVQVQQKVIDMYNEVMRMQV